MPLEPGDVVTIDNLPGDWLVNVVMVGGDEASVSKLEEREMAVLRGQDWRHVPVKSCRPAGVRMCAVHREPFPCSGCAYVAGWR